MSRHTRICWLLVAALCGAGCIERPETRADRNARLDRRQLSGIVSSALPTPAHPVGAIFGEGVELIGYDLSPEKAVRGGTVTVTYWWRATAPVDGAWKVFVHLEDEGRTKGRVIADHDPAGGRYLTEAWQPGEVIKDVWQVTIPSDAAPGLALWTGLFRGEARLPLRRPGRGVPDGENRLRAGIISVE
jgi:hypothetical protein